MRTEEGEPGNPICDVRLRRACFVNALVSAIRSRLASHQYQKPRSLGGAPENARVYLRNVGSTFGLRLLVGLLKTVYSQCALDSQFELPYFSLTLTYRLPDKNTYKTLTIPQNAHNPSKCSQSLKALTIPNPSKRSQSLRMLTIPQNTHNPSKRSQSFKILIPQSAHNPSKCSQSSKMLTIL